MTPSRGLLLKNVRVDPGRGGARAARLAFLAGGPVEINFRAPLTLLIGENGSGKTTLLEAIAARCAIRPGGGRSYAENRGRPSRHGDLRRGRGGIFRAPAKRAFFARRPVRGNHGARRAHSHGDHRRVAAGRRAERGEGVLSLLTARVDASEGLLYLLDEPETGLSPQRQMALLCLLDDLHRDGRSQAVVATHSPILMSHPGADLLWVDADGITRRSLDEIPHWARHAPLHARPRGQRAPAARLISPWPLRMRSASPGLGKS